MNLGQKILVVGAACALLTVLSMIVFGDNGLIELSRLRAKERMMAGQNQALARENIDLYRIVDRLKNDPEYIETIARNELGMVGKDDIVILRPRER